MKTLIILAAFLLALSSCTKEMPIPDSDPTYTPAYDPGDDTPPDYDPGDDGSDDGSNDDGSDDGSGSCNYNSHAKPHLAARHGFGLP